MLYILTPIFCAGLCLGTVFSFYNKDNKVSASAADSSAGVSIGKLTVDNYENLTDGKVFDASVLNKLYKAITGTASYSSLQSAFNNTSIYKTIFESKVIQGSTIYENAGNKDTFVTFGGIEWVVASATVDKGGEYVVTLLQKEASASPVQYSTWSNDSMAKEYPSNMYSTSYIRNYHLGIVDNAAGYSSSDGSLNCTNKASTYQVFTKDKSSLSTSLKRFLDTPNDIKYQEIENARTQGANNTQANDAYGTISGTTVWYSDTNSASKLISKTNYSNWKTDTIWLPSTVESGMVGTSLPIANSIWGMTASAHKASRPTWYRTSYAFTASYIQISQANGANFIDSKASTITVANPTSVYLRPAIHLNLTKAQDNARLPSVGNLNTSYTGQSRWIDTLKPSWYNDILENSNVVELEDIQYQDYLDNSAISVSKNEIIDAGVYTVTLKALPTGYVWGDGTSGTKTFTITVAKADPVVTATLGTGNLYVTDGLPKNDDGTAKVTNTAKDGTPGTFTWNANQTLSTSQTSYNCLFTPTDINNFNTKPDCPVNVTFMEDEVTGVTASVAVDGTGTDKLYTSYSLDKLKAPPFSLNVKLVYESGHEEDTSDYTLSVMKDGAPQDYFHAGTNNVLVESNGLDCDFTVEVIEAEIDSIKDVTFAQKGTTIYPNTPLDDIKALFTVRGYWNYNTAKFETLDKDTFKLDGTLVPGTGTSTLFVVYKKGGEDERYSIPAGVISQLKVDYLTYDMDGVKLTGEKTVTYDGDPHALTLTGELPEGVTAGDITYTKDGVSSTTAPTDAGTYTVTVSFTGDTVNHNPISDVTATLKIEKADYPGTSGITFKDDQFYNDGNAHSISATGVPEGVTVTYSCPDYNGGAAQSDPIEFTAEGKYNITAHFAFVNAADGDNYNAIPEVTKEMEISNLVPHDMEGVTASGSEGVSGDIENGFTATYGGTDFELSLDESSLPDGVTVDEVVYEKFDGTDWVPVTDGEGNPAKPNGAGQYRAKVSFENSKPGYAKPHDMEISFIIDKATADTSGTEFKPSATSGLTADGNGGYKATYKPDGNGIEFTVADLDPASIPAGATPKTPVYKKLVNGYWETVSEIKEAGEYKVVVEFEPSDPDNYNDGIAPVEIAITIDDAVVTGVSAKVEDGAKFDINNTLDDVIAKIKAEISFNNGTKEDVEVKDLTVTCATLREGGLLEVGKQTITVKYDDGIETTVEIVVSKVKVALPVYIGKLSYNGNELKPTAADFEGFDSALMAFVESKIQSGLNAGTYKAVFALTDTDRYEWATASTLKKALFALAYDEIVLDPTIERAVDWTIEKAVITAAIGADGKPVFKSDGISAAAIAQAVGLKFYADEACTQEVAADQLAYETSYYMQADLLDDTNFKLDSTVAQVLETPYTTPAKELTTWDKIVKFIKANWLWLVIAAVALILLILIIVLAARSAKKKREREERRLAEEKAERERREERDREERKLEREERMARMNQQQAMPQMMMPQMMPQMMGQQMPQSMPQQAQAMPMSAGGSSNEIAELKAEMAAMKAEQAAKEIAALRAEAAAKALTDQQIAQSKLETQFATMMARMGGEQVVQGGVGGVSLQALTELIRTEVRNAMADEKAAAQPAAAKTESAASSAAQVPPDAVMTTVTTTKIDTTKKPVQSAQNAQAAAPVRTVVRNVVAPMPVDDGRVFDVGGFYKPADPVTDMGMDEDKD